MIAPTYYAALVLTLNRTTNAIVFVDIHSSTANLCSGDLFHFTPKGWETNGESFEAALADLAESLARHGEFFAEPGTPLHDAIMAVSRGESGEVRGQS